MNIVSVNISGIQSIEHNGKIIETGFYKTPTVEPVKVGPSNIEGDKQADLKNHGGLDKAIYAFAADHYAYWQGEFGLLSMPPGCFGENLTVDGLFETQCMIGDQYSVGNVVIEVSQPRVPCFKLGVRFDDKTMPKRFISQGETGVYFRVVSTGTLARGDSLELVHRETDLISVHELFNAFYNSTDKEHVSNVLQRSLTLASLAQEWREKIQTKLR